MTAIALKALSIHQPWAALIVRGKKRIENRTWVTDYRGPLLIHAGKTLDDENLGRHKLSSVDIKLGAIIGVVDLVDCVPLAKVKGKRFAQGPMCWILRNARMFARSVPYKGQLGLFNVPDRLVRRLLG